LYRFSGSCSTSLAITIFETEIVDLYVNRTNRGFFDFVQAVLAGDYVISVASIALARIGNTEVVKVLSQVLDDLVAGMTLSKFALSFCLLSLRAFYDIFLVCLSLIPYHCLPSC